MAMNQGRSRFSHQTAEQAEGVTSQVTAAFSRGYEQAEQLVSHNPMASVLVFFGLGLGVGAMLGSTLFTGQERRELSRWRHRVRQQVDEPIERAARQILDAVTRLLPESIAGRLHG